MASPQLEEGHTRIAHEILEALGVVSLKTAKAVPLMLVLMRLTYGFQRLEWEISLKDATEALNTSKGTAHRAMNELIDSNLLTKLKSIPGYYRVRIQKDWSKWPGMPKGWTPMFQERNVVPPTERCSICGMSVPCVEHAFQGWNLPGELFNNSDTLQHAKDNSKDNLKDTNNKPIESASKQVRAIWENWRDVLEKKGARLGTTATGKINARLAEGYTVEQLMRVPHGSLLDPWKDRRAQSAVKILFRDSDQVTKFIDLDREGKSNGYEEPQRIAPSEDPPDGWDKNGYPRGHAKYKDYERW